MTADDIAKSILGLMVTALVGACAWLYRTVTGTREKVLHLESELSHVTSKVAALEGSQITRECVREVIEEALDKRDLANVERRAEWDKLHKLEMKEAMREELEANMPRLVREIRGDNDPLPRKR